MAVVSTYRNQNDKTMHEVASSHGMLIDHEYYSKRNLK